MLEYYVKLMMWRKFSLETIDLDNLCRTAYRPDLAPWLKGYYDNLRRNLFQRLDWVCIQWLGRAAQKEPGGWQGELIDGEEDENGNRRATPPPHNRYPSPPDLYQLAKENQLLISLKTMQDVWAPIDVVEPSVWTNRSNSNIWLLIAASRMYTYAKYCMATLVEDKKLSISEQTKMYESLFTTHSMN